MTNSTAPVDPSVLGARLRQQQIIEDPQFGELEPLALEARGVLWPHAANWALIELISITECGARRLEEYRFTPADTMSAAPAFAGPGLPVALMFERTPNGASHARMYSTPALRVAHSRSLAVDTHLQSGRDASDAVSRLLAILEAAEPEAALALFARHAVLQEPGGTPCQGREAMTVALQRLSPRSGDSLRYCTRLDEGLSSALELQLSSGRPALIVCERDVGGLLSAVRCYA